jgi:hypothetical protein
LVSVAGLLTAWAGYLPPDRIWLSALCGLGSLFLLLVRAKSRRPPRARTKARWIMVDGSNVMHWKDGTPQIATLREVLDRLVSLGFTPGVVFDANAGYKLVGRYQHDHALGRLLGLPEERVLVAEKGTPADPLLLASARDAGARIVTNDRYRDWAEAHPEVASPGHLIRGGYRDGQLWLDLGPEPQ